MFGTEILRISIQKMTMVLGKLHYKYVIRTLKWTDIDTMDKQLRIE